jgi:glycine cleavage system regulatory protein
MKDLAALTMAIIALFPYGSACASTSAEIREARLARHIEEAILALRFNGDADSLAAAALLSLSEHHDQSLLLIARASAAGAG